MDLKDVAKYQRSIDVVHSMTYFVPETEEHLVGVGLRPGRMCYFAGRAAPMGAVSPGVVAATFYNFNPSLVARHVPRCWTLATPEAVVQARFAAVDAALRRLLGDAADSPEITEAAELTRTASSVCTPEGRPLYAAHADLDWPEDPLLALWHGTTLLREHRGDGHLAALLGAGLSGLEALITHCATGRGFTVAAAQLTRGWSEPEWDAAVEGLRERGLLDADGALTDAGNAVRTEVEDATNRSATAPWEHLGADSSARLAEIGAGLTRQMNTVGVFPAGTFTTAR
ncbi:MAG: hypothetical protein ABI181_09760 [Mycobacteriaceae bacterium]